MWGTNFHTFFRVALIAKIIVSILKNPLESAYQYLQLVMGLSLYKTEQKYIVKKLHSLAKNHIFCLILQAVMSQRSIFPTH